MNSFVFKNGKLLIFVLLTFFCSLESSEKQRICLNMIVRNESHVIERALLSVIGVVDYWVIVDTGSVDGTQHVVREILKDIPGELYERPWVDFGHNRSEAVELARGKADYMLFLDADDWLKWDPNFVMPNLNAGAYWAKWQSARDPSFSYLKPLLIKDSVVRGWEGVIHEYVVYDNFASQEMLSNMCYVFTGEGSRSQDPKKYEKAAHILEVALQNEPENARYMFYLAESYKDADLPYKSLDAYLKRVRMGGWKEEVFWSWLQIGHLQKRLGYSYEDICVSYYEARRVNPSRSEPVYFLAEIYNEHKDYKAAYELIKMWENFPKSDKSDLLFHLGWVEDFGIAFQLSIASYYIGNYQESLDLHDQLLNNPKITNVFREQVLSNRKYPLYYCKIEKSVI